ncbi:alpha/beta hydrolase [Leptolyngbya sp. FACHB-36]|uniref:alpha/beta fold hydrolase n=1 Tax=Leptolyngbya sp. FACHB-36 TaxID=2692808 RepID=UPI0016804D7E|nr:alpha/beta hydrolase [Leptolyngbya sp. FACHB-36]MBD2020616.1 alpha/beta hydrolase [Leptolyngbya sp. FACHB-36]
MPYVSVRNFPHYYEWITASGQPEPSGKPVLIFVHGWGGSSRYWELTARSLSDTFDCLLYDLRGFGRSQRFSFRDASQTRNEKPALAEPPETAEELSYELESYAEDLAGLLDALELERIYLNAHSTGASIATFFLNLYPERVERAILTCSGIFEYDEKAFKTFHKFAGYVVRFRPRWLYGLPFVDRLFMQRFLHRPLSGEISRAFLDDFLMADYDAAIGTVLTSVSEKASQIMPQEFARLSVPTLLVSGQYDIIIPAEMGRQAAEMSGLVEHVVIPDTAHFPMLEDSDTYLRLVRNFLGVAQTSAIA